MKICFTCGARFSAPEWDCPVCGAAPPRRDGIPSFPDGPGGDERPYDPRFYRELAAVEGSHFWFAARNRLIVRLLERHAPAARDLLEVGCGTGFVLAGIRKAFPALSVSGCDRHLEGLRIARERNPGGRFCRMDGRRLLFDEEFDALGAFDVLEHVDDDRAVLAGMRRALRPKGAILISVPRHRALWSRADVEAGHARRYSAGELKRKVESAGFRVLETAPFLALLLPVLAASRLRGPLLGKRASLRSDLDLSPFLNAALGKVAGAEFQLIRMGLRLPFSGSVLVAARKS